MFDDEVTKSSADVPNSSTLQKPKLGISEQDFLSNIYMQKEHNAYKAMALLDMWQSVERSFLYEVLRRCSC